MIIDQSPEGVTQSDDIHAVIEPLGGGDPAKAKLTRDGSAKPFGSGARPTGENPVPDRRRRGAAIGLAGSGIRHLPEVANWAKRARPFLREGIEC